jgi:hypothetical protein
MNLESSTSVVPILHGEAEAPTRAGAPPETMQVRIPHGVPAGAKLQITGSSGNRLELVVPPNTPPGSLIQVEVPATGTLARAVAPPGTMQVRIPHGALPGAKLQIPGPNGNKMEIVVPPNSLPGSLIQVQVPAAGTNSADLEAGGIMRPAAAPQLKQDGAKLGNEVYTSERDASLVRISMLTEITFSELVAIVHKDKDTIFSFDLNAVEHIFEEINKDGGDGISLEEIALAIDNNEKVRTYVKSTGVTLLMNMAKYHNDDEEEDEQNETKRKEKTLAKVKVAFKEINRSGNHITLQEWVNFFKRLRRKRLEYYKRCLLIKRKAYAGHGMQPGKPYVWWHSCLSLPRGFLDDLFAYIRNNHPLLALFYADPNHPFSRNEKTMVG